MTMPKSFRLSFLTGSILLLIVLPTQCQTAGDVSERAPSCIYEDVPHLFPVLKPLDIRYFGGLRMPISNFFVLRRDRYRLGPYISNAADDIHFWPISIGTSIARFIGANEFRAQSSPVPAPLPDFDQYRLGGFYGDGVRGFRSFSCIGAGASLLAGAIELRKKLHLRGDNVVGRILNNNLGLNEGFSSGQASGRFNTDNLLHCTIARPSGGAEIIHRGPVCDFPLPVLWDDAFREEWQGAGESKYDFDKSVKKDKP
ncbi:MAG: hypothetical protein KGS72_15545 [Cyanobacteria bacterium REEB67]|nr:hypothetical protein [Cyanobacteria bacterium REEB67]